MMLHFAYGANMSRAVMRRHARDARALGIAVLSDHRFVIGADGYASIKPARAEQVYGVLWRITPRDRVTLDAWENVEGGIYRGETLPVRHGDRRMAALVYLARGEDEGSPRPGYIELVVAAAREWQLPPLYIGSLQAWTSKCSLRSGANKIGEFRWT